MRSQTCYLGLWYNYSFPIFNIFHMGDFFVVQANSVCDIHKHSPLLPNQYAGTSTASFCIIIVILLKCSPKLVVLCNKGSIWARIELDHQKSEYSTLCQISPSENRIRGFTIIFITFVRLLCLFWASIGHSIYEVPRMSSMVSDWMHRKIN